MKRPVQKAVLMIFLLLILGGLGYAAFSLWSPKQKTERSAWIADWQLEEGLEDFRAAASGLTSIQAFAVYFDENDRLLQTDNLNKAIIGIREIAGQENPADLYLTFVNDVVRADGTSSQKDAALISRLMANQESRSKLIEQIMDAAAAQSADGVEIDFERIQKEDWHNVILFYEELYQRLKASNLLLRIVLEPKAPLEEYKWPEGPIYVMMAYNLYGTHSGPGPKADDELIRRLAGRMKQLPGANVIALAAGGFDWSETGKVSAVTEKQALELAEKSAVRLARDGASGSVYFDYADDEGTRHTVWYADQETLDRWMKVAEKEGFYHTALWKLGGLSEHTLDGLRQK